MRILFVNHTPWSRNLGAPRVQLEIGEEWQKLGHEVEKFSYEDAFPNPQSRWEKLTANFSAKAAAYVKQNAHRFDIVEANQTDLPFSKAALGIRGLLVARSVGLIPMYEIFDAQERAKYPQPFSWKGMIRSAINYPALRRRSTTVLPSFQVSDLVNVPNQDEVAYIKTHMGLGEKCRCFPFGLTDDRRQAFTQLAKPPASRIDRQEVAFIGVWCSRKGSRDWPQIVRCVRDRVPNARFLFLGTGQNRQQILDQLQVPDGEWLWVIPSFESADLPKLLSSATVGAFPSYIEGFGFAVLEKLAAGLPTIAYDVPGPREMLRHLDADWMVPAGNWELFSDRLIHLLQLSEDAYAKLSQACMTVSTQFLWRDIAANTLAAYSEKLAEVRAHEQ